MTLTRSPQVEPLLVSWTRSLRADGKSPRTIASYSSAVRDLTSWCDAEGRPVAPEDQDRAVIEDYVAHLIADLSPGTAGVRYRSLRQWFRWLADEDEADDVMAGMKHPKLETKVVPIIADDDLRALLEVTKGRDLLDRRDHAMLRVLIDTGMRRGELVGLTTGDVDLDAGVLVVRRSKTGSGRLVPVGAKSTKALDAYLRRRPTHRDAERPELWLGIHGRSPERARVRCCGRDADRPASRTCTPVSSGTRQHTGGLIAGGQEQDLARIAGWSPGSAMLARYGASEASERAKQAHRTIAPGDSL